MPKDTDIVATQASVAAHFKVQRSTVTRWVAEGMPGKVGCWSLKAIDEWRRERQDEASLLTSTADSPWLEELRKNKALQEQIKLESMRRTVVQIDRMREALAIWSSILQRLGERIGRRFGREASDMIADAIDDCGRVLGSVFNGDGNGDGQPDENALASAGSSGKPPAKRARKRAAGKGAADKRVGRKRGRPAKRAVSRRKVQAPQAPGKPSVVQGFAGDRVE